MSWCLSTAYKVLAGIRAFIETIVTRVCYRLMAPRQVTVSDLERVDLSRLDMARQAEYSPLFEDDWFKTREGDQNYYYHDQSRVE